MRLGRVVTVMLSIALIGAIIGGTLGAVLLVAWGFPTDTGRASMASLAAEGALYGAVLGGVLAPITAWAFLRRVPLGKALLQVTIGTTIGTVIGLVFDRIGVNSFAWFPAGLAGALIGFLASAIRLRFATRTTPAQQGMESSGTGSGS